MKRIVDGDGELTMLPTSDADDEDASETELKELKAKLDRINKRREDFKALKVEQDNLYRRIVDGDENIRDQVKDVLIKARKRRDDLNPTTLIPENIRDRVKDVLIKARKRRDDLNREQRILRNIR
ncbi:uncharacterized protein LOC135849545 isoform X2 [Planococcus citri]|uniref:uncharacterized protein LOC135849545 isoform X2 n=1 Tax=Planococcus citri TaxID=170843 RepID=UPI0031F7C9D4